MPAPHRLTTLAASVCVSLAAAAAAFAAPPLQVTSGSHALGRAAALSVITKQGPAVYRTTIFAPAAYQTPDVAHLDRSVGTASVRVTTAVGALTFTGWITGVDPAGFVDDSCAAFAGDDHLAVWLLDVRQTDGLARAQIPVFVDAAPGGRTELAWCASSAADMTVTAVTLHLGDAFVNPVVSGSYAWGAVFDRATAPVPLSALSTVRL